MTEQVFSRRQILKSGLGLAAGAALPRTLLSRAGDRVGSSRGPNVVYIMADQLRACSVGCYANDQVSTPYLDRLAAQGARFGRAITSSPLCAPHRSCVLTGRYPTQTGVFSNGQQLPPDEVSLAEVFRQGGYCTGYIGKWHLDGQVLCPPDPGWVAPADRQGFSMWIGYNCLHLYYNNLYYVNRDPAPRQIPAGCYEPDWQTRRAIDWIAHNAGRPFFLMLSIGTPHPAGGLNDLPPGGDYRFPYLPNDLKLRANVDYPDLDLARYEYADYYGMISNLDWNVGRILSALSDLGLEENTIVVFTSDHGDYLGSHYGVVGRLRGKAVIYSEALDVPFLLRWLGHIDPMVVPDIFTSVDIMPTLLGLCGLPALSGVMGRDFSPVLTGTGSPTEPPWGPVPSTESALVGMYWPGGWIGVRTGEYTLACQGYGWEPTELYHDTEDPYQLVNRVSDRGYAAVREFLRDQAMAWLDYVGTPPS